ncbi:MAG: family 10 glycosylhydrolase [Candidatus Marinimicrobia bacterium]|nr:family 10 glycosylhydrolase [Candidatus Neomarinimicrobiota bacterium]
MKQIKVLLFILFIPITGLISQQSNTEFRSTWVITWNHISSSDTPAQGMERIRIIMDNHKAANMNAVLFQVRQSGTAYYNSSFEPYGSYSGYEYPGYDPLAYAVEQAHLRGLELHAWFNTFAAASTYPGTPAAEHPEWVCRDRDGLSMSSYRALSPGLEDVREYTVNVAMEIVNNYDIDGLHLDYVRWNEHSNGHRQDISHKEELQRMDGYISDEELEALTNNRSGRYLYDYLHPYNGGVPEGYSSWEEWWRWCVTEFVTTLHDSIQAVKPHVRLSAAVLGKYNWSGWQGYGSVYQDAALWFNEGYVDQLMPMHYHWTSPQSFYGMLEGNCPECWGQYIQPGVGEGRLFSVGPGSYILNEYNVWSNHAPIVDSCRTIPWVDGFQFFSYGTWDDHNYWDFAGHTFFDNQTKIRNISSNFGDTPDAPGLFITYVDSLTHDLTVIPKQTNENMWSILYRSIDGEINLDNAEIINIHFGRLSYTIRSYFTDVDDSLFIYASTTLNRYWTESPLSSIVLASRNPLPSSSSLGNLYPNPFKKNISIQFSITGLDDITINIFNILGQKVTTLIQDAILPGSYTISWDGKTLNGSLASSGIYFAVMKTNNEIKCKKICLVK